MNQQLVSAPFPGRISRTLVQAAGVAVGLVLLVGGTSLWLAARIFQNNEAVAREYDHILRLDQVHSIFDDLIFELHQMDSTGRLDRTADALLMQEDIGRQLAALAEAHRGQLGAAEPQHAAVLGDLRRLSEEGLAVTKRLAAGSGRLAEADLEWLNRATHEVPRRTEELAELHRSRISRLLESSQRLLQAIVALYVAFIVVGGALVAVVSLVASRGIAAPLRTLVHAAQGIAEGRLETRVRVASPNEIGRLSHAFNAMADRLEERERELRRAQGALEEKVRETQALYRVGLEISRLQQLDRVLQSVVDRTREMLRGDAAALCLFAPGGGGIVAQATSGPPEAFRARNEAPGGEPLPAGGASSSDAPSPLIRPEYARAHLAAPLRLGDDDVGAIHVSTREERRFTTDEAELLASLATQAAVAIERARLSEAVRSLGAIEERERLAREMHDGLAQELGLLHMKLQGALARSADTPAVAEDLREMVQITESAYEGVRQSIFGLRTFVSRGLTIVPTLTEYLHEFSAQNGIAVELEVLGGPLGPVPVASEVQAVRIIQAALTNVRKHAKAERARVRLERDGAWLRVTVEDDGVGWDRLAARERLHFGLQTMRERAESLGGRLEVEAAPGRGTRVVATLPGAGA
jgi:nitrate/nitrite-specific signal transduction histidine kinase